MGEHSSRADVARVRPVSRSPAEHGHTLAAALLLLTVLATLLATIGPLTVSLVERQRAITGRVEETTTLVAWVGEWQGDLDTAHPVEVHVEPGAWTLRLRASAGAIEHRFEKTRHLPARLLWSRRDVHGRTRTLELDGRLDIPPADRVVVLEEWCEPLDGDPATSTLWSLPERWSAADVRELEWVANEGEHSDRERLVPVRSAWRAVGGVIPAVPPASSSSSTAPLRLRARRIIPVGAVELRAGEWDVTLSLHEGVAPGSPIAEGATRRGEPLDE